MNENTEFVELTVNVSATVYAPILANLSPIQNKYIIDLIKRKIQASIDIVIQDMDLSEDAFNALIEEKNISTTLIPELKLAYDQINVDVMDQGGLTSIIYSVDDEYQIVPEIPPFSIDRCLNELRSE